MVGRKKIGELASSVRQGANLLDIKTSTQSSNIKYNLTECVQTKQCIRILSVGFRKKVAVHFSENFVFEIHLLRRPLSSQLSQNCKNDFRSEKVLKSFSVRKKWKRFRKNP